MSIKTAAENTVMEIRDLQNGYNRMFERLLYYTECQLATEFGYLERKATSRAELRRQAAISDGMITAVRSYAPAGEERHVTTAVERWERTKVYREERKK